jgi:RNA polymerase sigma-70 factor (ECF subfamily)
VAVIDATPKLGQLVRMASARVLSASTSANDRAELEWLNQLRVGDPLTFERIFRAYYASLCDFAHSYVRCHETAEEIVQDLFSWIWDRRFTLEMPHGMRLWLFTAVRNRSLNVIRDRRLEFSAHERYALDALSQRPAADPADAALSAGELSAAAARTVALMTPRCREAFTLIRLQHMSYADAAHVMGISPKTVEIHMTRAIAILRAALAPWLMP